MADHDEGDGAESRYPNEPQEPMVRDKQQFMEMFDAFMQYMSKQTKDKPDKPAQFDKTVDIFLKMHPPHFSGTTDPMIADDWLAQMEKIFEGMQCPENKRVALTTLVLSGGADHWWKTQHRLTFSGKPINEISWIEFCTAFKNWYIPASARERIQDELNRLRQKDMTVSEYENKFSALASYAPEMVSSESQRCYLFKRGLKDSIRKIVALLPSDSYKDLVEAARRLETEEDATEYRKKIFKRKENISDLSTPPVKKFGANSGEPSLRSKSLDSERSSFVSNAICDSCGRRHVGTCWGAKPGKSLHCYNCGEVGHIARYCPNANDESGIERTVNEQSGKGKQLKVETAISGQGSYAPKPVGRGRGQGGSTGNQSGPILGQGGPPRIYTLLSSKMSQTPVEDKDDEGT